jgi:hypothetical protein
VSKDSRSSGLDVTSKGEGDVGGGVSPQAVVATVGPVVAGKAGGGRGDIAPVDKIALCGPNVGGKIGWQWWHCTRSRRCD